jgi:hypothetical protein
MPPTFVTIPKARLFGRGWRCSATPGEHIAVVRWQCDTDGRWEVETRHPGFRHAKTAALFATGYSLEVPSRLECRQNVGPMLIFPNGMTTPLDKEAALVLEIGDDLEKVRSDLDARRLADVLGSWISFSRVHGYVIDPSGQTLDISIQASEPPSLRLSPVPGEHKIVCM